MRWSMLIVVAFLALVLEAGLRTAWVLPVAGGLTPSVLLIVMGFISLWAAPLRAAWAALVLGALADLSQPWAMHGSLQDLAILGPHALGFLAGSYVVGQLRSVVFRDSPISLAVLTFISGLFVHLVAVGLLTVRGVALPSVWFLAGSPPAQWNALGQLGHRFLALAYTAVVAWPLAAMLLRTLPWWSFDLPRTATR